MPAFAFLSVLAGFLAMRSPTEPNTQATRQARSNCLLAKF
jgi:hypothetical protein